MSWRRSERQVIAALYCATRKNVDTLYKLLTQNGYVEDKQDREEPIESPFGSSFAVSVVIRRNIG